MIDMRKQTKAIHTTFAHRDPYGALSIPVYHSVAYEFEDAQTMSDTFRGLIVEPDYSRTMNPTVTHLENKVKEITGASNVTAFNSGMAAISNTLIALSGQGRTIITSRHLFGNTVALMNTTLKRFGVRTKRVDLTKPEEVADTMDDSVCCIFLEIMTNPQLEVAPLKILADIAHRHNVPLVADSTMIPFTEHQLHNLGVDIELVSSTKYVSGGATSLGGLVIDYSAPESFRQSISQEMLFNLGAYMTPHAAYMQTIGLETLHARYAVQSNNALTLAKKLKGIEIINNVGYVGLPDNPYHEIAHEQFGKTAGAMLTIDLNDREQCFRFINNLKLIKRATNLFDNRTLAIHPASTIFGNFTDDERREMDVRDTTIRISIGLEDVDDIYEVLLSAKHTHPHPNSL